MSNLCGPHNTCTLFGEKKNINVILTSFINHFLYKIRACLGKLNPNFLSPAPRTSYQTCIALETSDPKIPRKNLKLGSQLHIFHGAAQGAPKTLVIDILMELG